MIIKLLVVIDTAVILMLLVAGAISQDFHNQWSNQLHNDWKYSFLRE